MAHVFNVGDMLVRHPVLRRCQRRRDSEEKEERRSAAHGQPTTYDDLKFVLQGMEANIRGKRSRVQEPFSRKFATLTHHLLEIVVTSPYSRANFMV